MSHQDEGENALLLDMAREAFRGQIVKRVRPLARSYVEKWMQCEFWLHRSVVQRHATELREYEAVVLETLRGTTVEEMLEICRRARPDLDDFWIQPAARDKLQKEIAESIDAIEAL